MESSPQRPAPSVCPNCGSQIAASLLACPGCDRLLHAERLKTMAEAAAAAMNTRDLTAALMRWREALDLLPPSSRQYLLVQQKVAALSRQIDELPPSSGEDPISVRSLTGQQTLSGVVPARRISGNGASCGKKSSRKTVGAMAVAGAMFLVTKGKLLLGGLLKGGTFLSMLASMGLYWSAYGWRFAAGLVVSIYIHEMGHVAMLRRYGIKASAPMFIPGIGAVVRLKQHPATPSEDASVGLAGPMWGVGAALGAYAVSLAAGWPSWAAIAHVGAWVNLFNLIPIWQLDGGRAFNAMTSKQRGVAGIALFTAWIWVQDGLLVLTAIIAIGRAFSRHAPIRPDRRALMQYLFLVAVLSAMLKVLVPVDRLALVP